MFCLPTQFKANLTYKRALAGKTYPQLMDIVYISLDPSKMLFISAATEHERR